MRNTFFTTLFELASNDRRVNLVVGDLGFGVIESFAQSFPDQFLNAGVAEQNMMGIAVGMALSGKTVFAYSIANFPTLRCLEQIRNDACYHNADVKVIAVGGGLAYGALGMSHHATEDISIMRALPGMIVVAPGDPIEVQQATRAIAAHSGPCYMRLGRTGEPVVHTADTRFELGRAILVRDGVDLTLISTGAMLPAVVAVAGRLADNGVSARVLSMHTIKPLDAEAVLRAARDTGAIVTVEEHSLVGGLGSAVAEIVAESLEANVPLKRIALEPVFCGKVGSQDYLRRQCGLSEDQIFESTSLFWKKVCQLVKPSIKRG